MRIVFNYPQVRCMPIEHAIECITGVLSNCKVLKAYEREHISELVIDVKVVDGKLTGKVRAGLTLFEDTLEV